ncbi:T9SS type A sorting domain-containing protein [Constantimarinum furrinae]|uniref:CARDB domain-containing protein n=1 Tax=Constantimarinum furrinae TaxID=2562285 RepID=A0A7G8PVX8_9FLAO|nr:T9SS type A sorting domain-containing protein [Constantimarinum furrinae]QNJ98494.1 hypothetical protein ALE3EI_1947 [Constantimarinum furrinae]
MKNSYALLTILLISLSSGFAQNSFPPVSVSEGIFLGETMPLRDFPTVEPTDGIPENLREVPMNSRNTGRLNPNALPQGPDPLIQGDTQFTDSFNVLQNFDGATVSEGQAVPPDPSGAAGPNHYVHAVNVVVKIFDKSGTLLAGPTFLGSFLQSGNNSGDPIVMYDQLADRFFVSQFKPSTNALVIGVSTTPDPTGSYYLYQFPLNSFPDYPHYSVWPNAYFLTANKSGQTTYALERDKMLIGAPSPQITGFSLPGAVQNPTTVFSPEPANLLGTDYPANVPGYIVYLQDDAWSGSIAFDHLKIWSIDLDWENTGNSSISSPEIIPTTPFDSFLFPFGSGDISQPGTSQRIDAISGVISYMANYRSFPTHNSFLVNFNVDLGSTTSGIRWIELRNVGNGPFTIFQEGTWTLNDGESRFMGSTSMDEDGNIGLAYNKGSSSNNVDIMHTGRLVTDPPGTMTVAETLIISSGGVQSNTNRFGDYAQMTMDLNNRTFWHTAEYFSSNNFWRTRIASFKLKADVTNDVGVYNFAEPFLPPFTSSENVEVSLYNYGTSSQSNFDIELYLDGSLVATETFTGTLAPEESATYTFTQSIDIGTPGQPYVVEARTILAGDQYGDNDEFERTYFQDLLSAEEQAFNEKKLLIYPVSDRIYEIRFSSSVDFGDMSYKVMNLLGQAIELGDMKRIGAGYVASVNLASSSSGVYIVEVSNGKEKASKRLLVK